jgi:hypothetical protein
VWHWKGDITPEFIAGSTALMIFFYPSVNPQYMSLLIPFVCIGMLGNERRVRKIALLEYIANMVAFSFPIYAGLLGFDSYHAEYLQLTQFPRLDFFAWNCCWIAPFLISLVLIVSPETIDRILRRLVPRKNNRPIAAIEEGEVDD